MSRLTVLMVLSVIVAITVGCNKKATEPILGLPVIETGEVSQISSGIPNISITVVSNGDSPIIDMALCWGTEPNPDFSGDHVNLTPGTSTPPYMRIQSLYQLTPGATYYVRSYAKNAQGEVWGNQVSFTMLPLLWDKIDLGINSALYKVFFHDTERGWICGSNGLIRKTLDGGNTWQQVSSGTNVALYDMHWIDADRAWIVGQNATVLKTVNGGVTWQAVNIGYTPASELRAVYFNDTSTGYVTTCYGAVYKTTDAGSSWLQVRNESDYTFNDIWCNGDLVILAGQGLRKSTNGGLTWQSQLGTDGEYRGICYQSSGTLWICGISNGGSGNIVKSIDNGATWTNVPNSIRHGLSDFNIAPNTDKMWVVGDYGTIFDSVNGGTSWNLNYNLYISTFFKSIAVLNETKVWIVGDNGTLLRLRQ